MNAAKRPGGRPTDRLAGSITPKRTTPVENRSRRQRRWTTDYTASAAGVVDEAIGQVAAAIWRHWHAPGDGRSLAGLTEVAAAMRAAADILDAHVDLVHRQRVLGAIRRSSS